MNRTAVLAFSPALPRIELFKQRRQIFDDALQLHFSAIDQLMAVGTVPFKSVQRAFGARHFNHYSDCVSGPLWRMAKVFGQKKDVPFFDGYFERRFAGRLHDAQRDVAF